MDIQQIEKYEDKFTLKIVKVERTTSQVKENGEGGNPMDVVDCEFVNNQPMRVFDKDLGEKVSVDPNGFGVRAWVTYTPNTIGSVNAFRKSLGLEPVKTVEEAKAFDGNMVVGQVADAWVKFKQRPLKNSAGEVVLHNGQPIGTGEIRVDKWLPKN